MGLTFGIVGLPAAGKPTLFNALAINDLLAANYAFATIGPIVGVVPIVEPRHDHLAEIHCSEKILPATVTFVAIAGIMRGASESDGLDNEFLANIRETDAICQVVRAFTDEDVVHFDGKVNPATDMDTINTELNVADLQSIEKAFPRVEKEVKGKDMDAGFLKRCSRRRRFLSTARCCTRRVSTWWLCSCKSCTCSPLNRSCTFLTLMPTSWLTRMPRWSRNRLWPGGGGSLDAKTESELVELDEEEATELLQPLGQNESGLTQLARTGFNILGLPTYLISGPQESRAWTIRSRWTAPRAVGALHTSFEKSFIKAEGVSFDDLDAAGSMVDAKSAGKVRVEGKGFGP